MVHFSKLWLLSLLLLVFSSSVLAVSVKGSLDVNARTITRDGTATFSLNVSHDSPVAQIFEVYTSDVLWDLRTEPSANRILTVPPGETVSTTLLLRPLYAYPGYYVVPISVKVSGSLDGITLNPQIAVLASNTPQGEYSPSISVRLDSPSSLDPRKEVSLKVNLENLNLKDLSKVDVKLRSSLFNQDYSTSLSGLEKKSVSFKLSVDSLTKPQDDVLRVSVLVQDPISPHQFEAEPFVVSIEPYGGLVFEPVSEIAFLERITRVKVSNSGNVDRVGSYTLPGSFLNSLVSKGTPAYERKIVDGVSVFSWDVSLGVSQSSEIVLVTNYRLPIIVLVLIVLGIVGYRKFRSPIIVHKSAVVVGTKEGGISEFKVLLEVKNRSSNVLKNVNILDSLPHMVDVMKEFEAGSLHPVSIMKQNNGTLIKWVVDDLDGFEERVITYKIKSKLSILGGLTLPVAVAKFDTPFGRRRSSKSNTAHLGISSHKGKMFQ